MDKSDFFFKIHQIFLFIPNYVFKYKFQDIKIYISWKRPLKS